MSVYKAFWRVLNRCKLPVILYTVILVAFAASNMQTDPPATGFNASRPDILIVNRDPDAVLTQGLVAYMESRCEAADISSEGTAMDDALFYREVSYILDIPPGYADALMAGTAPDIEVKSTGDYEASLAEMHLSRYLRTAKIYAGILHDQKALVDAVDKSLSQQVAIQVTDKKKNDFLTRAAYYYNFAAYSLLAGCVYVICLILSSFERQEIRRRTAVSSMNFRRLNRALLLGNSLFALVLWLFYAILSVILIGREMLSPLGLLFMLNSLVFTGSAVTLAFLIGHLVTNKNAISGIVNVVALGASFLCGAFVPPDILPDGVLKAAHILPAYWYIQTNEYLKTAPALQWDALRPVGIHFAVMLGFALLFAVLAHLISRRRRRDA